MAQQNSRARQRQRQRFIVILLLLLLAGVGFFMFTKKPEKPKKVRRDPPGMVKVPTLKANVGPGTRLSKKLITNQFLSPREVPTDALLATAQFLGRFTTRPILEGQYIKESDVSADGAVGRYSAMAKPGMRLVVLNANLFPGSLYTLRVGDRVDLLAFQGSKVKTSNRRKSNKNSGAVDGNQPGSGGNTKKRNRSRNSNLLQDPGSMSATLVAENAEVMSVPKLNRGKNISGHNTIVLQMHPQDAHITSLMAASNTPMRAVFRPYGDDKRLTQPLAPTVTTRLPKPLPDPDVVNVIVNGRTYTRKPNSTLYASDTPQQYGEQPNVIYGRQLASETNQDIEPVE